jgi:L-lactate utilization protein LutC
MNLNLECVEEPKQTLQEYEQQGLEKYSYEFELEKSNENVINVLINDYVQELIDSKSVEAHERTWISSICYHVINKAQETLEERIREALKDSFSKGMIVQTGFDTNEESENMFIDKFIQSLKQPK